ncbi:hypothetical protein M409DRAFT_56644 [Zasmidium cellare ATCC 36951]|uniref:Tautomerase cis-CaaD-like domain-containing protein n=1 Tax=Zasmidium cellare ATCC 36951 TaxID=1080233 RepID=A0A6A6CBG4_ZASCE|nr:uncharacterized protein M409DRAFT_56644 [Zasmidium cellare ATCC 36951]KAF2164371.1 hypothetical protein M409DRAFT_56644 [Zasmidium cellare ATCC 36951]
MPRWNFELTKDVLTQPEKQQLATDITNLYYEKGLPKFLINVIYNEHPVGGYFAGAKSPAKAVFFIISHAARAFPDEESALQFHKEVDDIIRPLLEPKGLKWECNIYEQSSYHWRVNGVRPPVMGSDGMKKWVEEDRPT